MELTTTEIRIIGARKNIEKIRSTIERHNVQLAKKINSLRLLGIDYNLHHNNVRSLQLTDSQYWLVCDIEGIERDISSNVKKLAFYRNSLIKWEQEKGKIIERQNSVPKVEVVEEFLQKWRSNVEKSLREQRKLYPEWCLKHSQDKQKLFDKYGYSQSMVYEYLKKDSKFKEEYELGKFDYKQETEYKKNHFDFLVLEQAHASDKEFEKELARNLDRDVEDKRYDFFARCSSVVGVITDASGLRIGNDGSINGMVVGEDGSASVRTIGAGGYNIQRYHYRVLVRRVK